MEGLNLRALVDLAESARGLQVAIKVSNAKSISKIFQFFKQNMNSPRDPACNVINVINLNFIVLVFGSIPVDLSMYSVCHGNSYLMTAMTINKQDHRPTKTRPQLICNCI